LHKYTQVYFYVIVIIITFIYTQLYTISINNIMYFPIKYISVENRYIAT